MSIVLVGLNHRTAPVEMRERLAFSEEACAQSLRRLVDGETIREGLIFSTCNRVEVLATTERLTLSDTASHISDFLSQTRSVPLDLLRPHLYVHADEQAVRHVFRVACSLDSMVVGEPQILGQVRRAYALAVEVGTAGRVLHRLLHHAFHTAKRVRTETGIGAAAISISYTAVELGRKIFGALEDRAVLLIGAGEMAELALRHLVKAGASRILVANRTAQKARQLAAQFGGEAVAYELLAEALAQADVIICSTGAERYVITPEMARHAKTLRRNQPIFIIDISVPRNVDPQVGELDDVFLFDIDDLEAVIESNIREREREAQRAELIVDAEVMRFQQRLRDLDLGPTVGALKQKLIEMAREEYQKRRSRLGQLTPEQERAVEALLMATVNKISHPIIHRLRRSYETGDLANVQAWRDIFGLEDEPGLSKESDE
ncbi:MAG: glutamyl-tRNA reductase [Pyrinomonas sp.]|uniref:glutamyl-tRNA reductase n=1 Tax=Pyrinomonas sp. TaxID=2080306 RepID=UPI00331BB05B